MTPRTVHILAVLCVLSWSALAVGVAYLTGVGLAPNRAAPPDVSGGPRALAPPAAPAAPFPHPAPTAAVDESTGSPTGSSGATVTVVRHAEPVPRRNTVPAPKLAADGRREPPPAPTGSPQRPQWPGPPADPPPVQPPIPPVDPGEVVDEVVDQVPGVGPRHGDRPRGVGPSAAPPGHGRDPDHLPPGHRGR